MYFRGPLPNPWRWLTEPRGSVEHWLRTTDLHSKSAFLFKFFSFKQDGIRFVESKSMQEARISETDSTCIVTTEGTSFDQMLGFAQSLTIAKHFAILKVRCV